MVWNAQNSPYGFNFSAQGAPNFAARAAPNFAARAAPNFAARAAHNLGQNFSGHQASNFSSHLAGNFAPYQPTFAGDDGPAQPGTGAGGSSGSGFMGGYGPVARFEYAAPAGLGPLPWVMDFAQGNGWPSFPFDQRINPYRVATKPLEWQNSEWDPALRFWSLEFDPQLTEWLQDVDLAAPSVIAAREFAQAHLKWRAGLQTTSKLQLTLEEDSKIFDWQADKVDAWIAIGRELDELVDLMRDDRMRYAEELAVQSSHAAPYFVHLMGFNPTSKPWTMELMNCASSIGNLVKMQYKSHYRRVRPSVLCPALAPPWGPPQHPAFPSGHSTVAHLTSLLLLSIKGIHQRFGVFPQGSNIGEAPTMALFEPQTHGLDQRSPLLWLAWRIAKGRERLGVHYASDSAAGRRLAAIVWDMCLNEQIQDLDARIDVPALRAVLTRAAAEWPELP